MFDKLRSKRNKDCPVVAHQGVSGVELANDKARMNKKRALDEFPAVTKKPAT